METRLWYVHSNFGTKIDMWIGVMLENDDLYFYISYEISSTHLHLLKGFSPPTIESNLI